MQLKVFVLPVKNLGAAEAEMNAFLRGHRVLAVKKEFVADGENSFWSFTIHDPKERTICAAHFRERVMHHALMNVCEPALERAAIFDSYACRQGKGQLAEVRRAESYARQYGWFLKMDVRKYSLGYRVFPQELRMARRSKLRFARKFRRYEGEWVAGRWTELQLQQRMQALVAFTLPARSRPWRRHVLQRFRVVADPAAILSPERGVPGQTAVVQGPV